MLVVLALQRRMDRVEHKVHEREDLGTAFGLTRVGETTKLQSGPSTLIRRAQILPMFRSCCSSVAWSNSVGASRFMHTQDVRHNLAPRLVIPAVSQAAAHASSRHCSQRLPARSAGTTWRSARWASGWARRGPRSTPRPRARRRPRSAASARCRPVNPSLLSLDSPSSCVQVLPSFQVLARACLKPRHTADCRTVTQRTVGNYFFRKTRRR